MFLKQDIIGIMIEVSLRYIIKTFATGHTPVRGWWFEPDDNVTVHVVLKNNFVKIF